MVETRTDEKTIVCCGNSISAEKFIFTTRRRFLGWSGIRRNKRQLFSGGETFEVLRWHCKACGAITQSGIERVPEVEKDKG